MRRLSWTSSTYLGRSHFDKVKANSHGTVQEVDLLTNQANVTEFFQYIVSSGSGFSEILRGYRGRKKVSPVRRIVVLSLSFQLLVRHEQVINVIPPVGKSSLTSNTEQLIRLPIEASMLRPDCVLGSLDYSHEFSEHQGRIYVVKCYNRSCISHCFSPKTRVKVCGR